MKIFLISILLIYTTNAGQQKIRDISPIDIKQEDTISLESGEQILYKRELKNHVWPELHIHQLINATPLESLAIFLALDHQKNYLPDLIKSTPIKHITPTEVLTEYELDLPWPLPNSHYTHGSNFTKTGDDSYRAYWYMVKSDSAEKVDGFVTFKNFKGKTLMSYHTRVVAKSFLAGVAKGFMVKDTTKSIAAIKTEIERAKQHDPSLLRKYVRYIVDSLKGINVYENK